MTRLSRLEDCNESPPPNASAALPLVLETNTRFSFISPCCRLRLGTGGASSGICDSSCWRADGIHRNLTSCVDSSDEFVASSPAPSSLACDIVTCAKGSGKDDDQQQQEAQVCVIRGSDREIFLAA